MDTSSARVRQYALIDDYHPDATVEQQQQQPASTGKCAPATERWIKVSGLSKRTRGSVRQDPFCSAMLSVLCAAVPLYVN